MYARTENAIHKEVQGPSIVAKPEIIKFQIKSSDDNNFGIKVKNILKIF